MRALKGSAVVALKDSGVCKIQAPDHQTPLKPHKDEPLLEAKKTLERQLSLNCGNRPTQLVLTEFSYCILVK